MKCLICGADRFTAHQILRADIIIDENGNFVDNMPCGLEASVYDASKPYGPFTCCKCGTEYDCSDGSDDCIIDGSDNWIITDNPFTDPDSTNDAWFRASDAKTHKTVTLHLQRTENIIWTIDLYDTTFGQSASVSNLMLHKENVPCKENAVATAIDIFDGMSHMLDKNAYTFEQIDHESPSA